MREVISTADAPGSPLYSQAVRAGNHIYVSGLVGIDATTGALAGPTIQEQARQALSNCETVLRAAGASLDDVVEVGILLTDPADFAGLNEEYATWFPATPPTRYVAKLGVELPGVLVSIRMTAHVAQMGDRLRPLWDFNDLDSSEARFRAQLGEETTDAGRAEVLTQLARVEGLRANYEQSDVLLDEAEALGGAETRVLLERGRWARSSGRPGAGQPQFEQAFELALARGEDVLAVDAAHMVALVDDIEAWTARGVEIAASSDDPGVRYWLGPLYNNVGWSRYEAGDTAGALEAFELALASRERDDPRPYPLASARYAVGKALRAAGRAGEAAAVLEQCVAWAAEAGVEDDYFHEELAEDYAALGRDAEAGDQARRALALVSQEDDPSRAERLAELASRNDDSG